MHSARATHSKETVVGSLRNFANATFLASLPGRALRSCRSSPAAFNPCPVVIIQKNIFPAVPSRHHVVGHQPANFWPWTHFYRPPHLLVNMFMHTDPLCLQAQTAGDHGFNQGEIRSRGDAFFFSYHVLVA